MYNFFSLCLSSCFNTSFVRLNDKITTVRSDGLNYCYVSFQFRRSNGILILSNALFVTLSNCLCDFRIFQPLTSNSEFLLNTGKYEIRLSRWNHRVVK